MVNFFNSYFINIISDLLINHTTPPNTNPLNYVTFNSKSFFFLPSSPYEVEQLINHMKSKPTHLLDIPFHVIKSISKPLSNIISFIYNLCIEQGKYPDLLKHARVTPIHKSGDKLEVCNYRPISTLLSVNKIFEKLTYERMLSFIDSCGLITEYQFGFRKKRSTTDAIFEVIQFVSSGLNKKEHVIYLFLDLKKAFDSVSHKV